MRVGAPAEVLSGSAEFWPVVSSWRGGDLLAESVPILAGRVTWSTQAQIPDRVSVRVPRWDGRDWFPGADAMHPLARFGQELAVSVVVRSSARAAEWETRLGRFLITSWSYSDSSGEVTVTGEGLFKRVADDRLLSASAPRPDGTLASEARRLLPLGMFAGFDPALVDRPCPQTVEWAEDRLEALYEIADAWPARLRVDPWGAVQFLPPLPEVPLPVLSFRDGARGTVVGVDREDTREGAYNRVVARSTGSEPVQGVAEQTFGPMAAAGPYGTVTRFWSSPLLTTAADAKAAAESMLRASLLPSRTIPVEAVPDPRVELDDAVEVVRDGRLEWGWVVGVDLPLTVADGSMRLDVGVAS